jgi:hypothetical protein
MEKRYILLSSNPCNRVVVLVMYHVLNSKFWNKIVRVKYRKENLKLPSEVSSTIKRVKCYRVPEFQVLWQVLLVNVI